LVFFIAFLLLLFLIYLFSPIVHEQI